MLAGTVTVAHVLVDMIQTKSQVLEPLILLILAMVNVIHLFVLPLLTVSERVQVVELQVCCKIELTVSIELALDSPC